MSTSKEYQIPRSDLCMAEAMPFSQHWEARIAVPIKSVEDFGRALQAHNILFQPGDLVNVCSFTDKTFSRLAETCSLRIVSKDDGFIKTAFTSEVFRAPAVDAAQKTAAVGKLEIVKIRNAFEVRDEKGNTIEAFVDEAQARTYAESMAEKPKDDVEDLKYDGMEIRRGFQGRIIVKNSSGDVLGEFKNKEDAEEFIAKHSKALENA